MHAVQSNAEARRPAAVVILEALLRRRIVAVVPEPAGWCISSPFFLSFLPVPDFRISPPGVPEGLPRRPYRPLPVSAGGAAAGAPRKAG